MATERQDFLQELGYLGFTMRFKRMSDKLMHDGRRLYQSLGLDIEPNWYGVFLLLDKYGKMGVVEIAEHLQLSHPSAITIINKMEVAGYIKAHKDALDQRRRHLTLTANARKKLASYKRIWSAGTEAVRQLTARTNIYTDLAILEDHFNNKNFVSRTLEGASNEEVVASELKIVPFSEQYAADFGRINYEWLHMYFKVEPYDYEMLDHPKSHIVDKGGEIFFGLYDEVVAGTAALIHRGPGTFELAKMGVSPIYKGKGIGQKLMEHSIDFARQKGCKTVYLESNRSLAPALALYKKYGFEEVALDPNTPYERCDIKMELKLN